MPRLGLLCLIGGVALAAAPTEPPTRRIAVTVDDVIGRPWGKVGPMNRAMIDILVAEHVPAVAFVNEGKLYENEKLEPSRVAVLQMWKDAGFELGNHTYSHPDLNKVGVEAYEADLLRGETVMRSFGVQLRWFRHCFLRTGRTPDEKAAFEAFLTTHGYRVAPVTIENDDWAFSAAWVKARKAGDKATMTTIEAGYLAHFTEVFEFYEGMSRDLFGHEIAQVLLVHDNALNAEHLDDVLKLIRARGYTFISLEEALRDTAYSHADTYVGQWGKSWLQRWWFTEGRPSRFREEPRPPDYVDAG